MNDNGARLAKSSKLTQWLSTLFGLVLFIGATWFLQRELQKYRLIDILVQLQSISLHHIIIALILSFFGHLVLTWFDLLGMHYLKQPVPYRRIALASYVSYVLSHNIGAWSGAPYRFRVYHHSGLSAFQITLVVMWCGLTFWLGFFCLAGILLLTVTPSLAEVFSLSPVTMRVLGILFLAIIATYLFWSWRHKKSLKIFKWYLWPPNLGTALTQILVSVIDWMLAGSVLYFLFPESAHVPYWTFLGVFVLAQVSGFTSQIPGGLGVFEFIFVEFLTPKIPVTTVLGTLVAYRAIYYILPLTIGIIILGISEISRKRQRRKETRLHSS